MTTDLHKLNASIGSPFAELTRLKLALTHRSFGSENNERLEFLGDSILNFIIARDLYERFPEAREGRLSRLRAKMVKRETLAEIAREFNLGDYLIMGSGELKSGGFNRNSILSDALEAIIGAIYLETDFNGVSKLVLSWFDSRLSELSLESSQKDAKTLLQETMQARGANLPEYNIVKIEGKSHNQTFYVECSIEVLTETVQGKGGTRRTAEQHAAEAALKLLDLADDK